MKRFLIFLLILIVLIAIPMLVMGMSEEEIADVIKNTEVNVVGVMNVGFKKWFMANWYFFVLSVIGLGRLIVFFTASEKDDKWYGKYILKPFNLIGKALSLDIAKKKK